MNDLELIEGAVKAAGYMHAACYEANPERGEPFAYAVLGKGLYCRPLGDLGDAFRLAVKLNLNVKFGASDSDYPQTLIYVDLPRHRLSCGGQNWVSVEFIPDALLASKKSEDAKYVCYLIRNYPELVQGKEAATCRAIVRAAAALASKGETS